MARKPTNQQILDALSTRYEKNIADALFEAFQNLRDNADISRAVAALSANDIQGFLNALHLDPAALGGLEQAIQQAYLAGGQAASTALQGAAQAAGLKLAIRFDGRHITAETWLRQHSADLVTNILADQVTAIRAALTIGLAAGQNPTTTALAIVGRINRVTGQRTGGIIGLSSPQADYLASARRELASGDPALLRNYLTRQLRDKRFDPTVIRAIADQAPVSGSDASAMLTQYSNRMLKARGDTVGLQETFTALNSAKHDAMQQAVSKGIIRVQTTTKTWRHFPNRHPREQHIEMNGVTVGMNEKFQLPDGTMMMYPHDPNAPIGQTINCHCQADYKVNFLAGVH